MLSNEAGLQPYQSARRRRLILPMSEGVTCGGGNFSECSEARQQRGRLRQGRNNRAGYDGLACCSRRPRAIRNYSPALPFSRGNSKSSAGRTSRLKRAIWHPRRSDSSAIREGTRRATAGLAFSQNTETTKALLQQTHIIPIIFAIVSDPVGDGFVASFPRPGGMLPVLPLRTIDGRQVA